ncbi:MAG: hypothetical protein AUH92_01275 [Acidobacteria bacterium 13_1_40CM_4_69_4]|nr:MAG: hypothetical protein AUH92_01275 [Acidobacteria bacterium 13_1_40CM_4_69_4]HKN46865.1 response regulator [Candidatus Polarisedimenticolia bacterium]
MLDTSIGSSPRNESLVKALDAGLDEARVLVVEDDDAMRLFLEEALKEEGYVVTTASNTLSAIVALMCEGVDVTVIDWKMPDLDGFALLSAVQRCFARVPVIFVTAFARPDVEERAVEGGAFSFLPKPFRLSVLVAEIERALETGPPPGGTAPRPSGVASGERPPLAREGPVDMVRGTTREGP